MCLPLYNYLNHVLRLRSTHFIHTGMEVHFPSTTFSLHSVSPTQIPPRSLSLSMHKSCHYREHRCCSRACRYLQRFWTQLSICRHRQRRRRRDCLSLTTGATAAAAADADDGGRKNETLNVGEGEGEGEGETSLPLLR